MFSVLQQKVGLTVEEEGWGTYMERYSIFIY